MLRKHVEPLRPWLVEPKTEHAVVKREERLSDIEEGKMKPGKEEDVVKKSSSVEESVERKHKSKKRKRRNSSSSSHSTLSSLSHNSKKHEQQIKQVSFFCFISICYTFS